MYEFFFFIFSFLHALPFTLSADKFFLYVRHFPFGCMKWMSDWADSCAFEMGVNFLSCISFYFFFFSLLFAPVTLVSFLLLVTSHCS